MISMAIWPLDALNMVLFYHRYGRNASTIINPLYFISVPLYDKIKPTTH